MPRASESTLSRLHDLLAQGIIKELKDIEENDLPISPQLIAATAKFLKDNEITCQIEAGSTTSELKDELSKHREARKARVASMNHVEEG